MEELKKLKKEKEESEKTLMKEKEESEKKLMKEKEKSEKLKKEKEKLEDRVVALEQDVRLLNLKKFIESKSNARAYKDYIVYLNSLGVPTKLNEHHLPFSKPSLEKVQDCWQKCKDVPDFPDSCNNISGPRGEDLTLHPILQKLLTSLLEWLGVDYACVYNRKNMRDPPIIPDFVLVSLGMIEPGFPDVVGAFEAKLPVNNDMEEGTRQASLYLYHALHSLPQDDPDRHYRFGVAFDYLRINVVYFENGAVPDLLWTQSMPLFPSNWRELESPTMGFEWLCHVLSIPKDTFVSSCKTIQVHDQSLPVIGSLVKDIISVYEVSHGDELLIAKVTRPSKHPISVVAVIPVLLQRL
jgi:hypothetical protein